MTKEKQKSKELHAVLDPGYLMLAVYVLGVSFLVMFAWFGGGSTALDSGHHEKENVVSHELMIDQPVVAEHFIADLADQGESGKYEARN